MWPSTRERSNALELMDDLSLQGPELERTLAELEIVNRVLGGYGTSLEGLNRLRAGRSSLSVLDVGCGSGDIPRRFADWGRKVGCDMQVTGIDLTQTTIDMARRRSAAYADTVQFELRDLFTLPDEPMFDVVHAAATLHHFVGDDAQRAVAKMYRLARLGVVINDFHRHPLAWIGIRILSQVFSKSRLVRYDGPLSVLRSFHRRELVQMCEAEGLPSPQIAWRPMFRWRVVIPRPPSANS